MTAPTCPVYKGPLDERGECVTWPSWLDALDAARRRSDDEEK